ncbi:MAG: NAD(+)/NADH kinase [Acidilobus sp.]
MTKEVGLVARPSSSVAERLAVEAVRYVVEAGWRPLVEVETLNAYPETFRGIATFSLDRDPPRKVIVIGGDGTLLRAAIKAGDHDVTFMAVRAGKRGFLLDVDETELRPRIADFLNDKYQVVEHQRIQASVAGRALPCALNDVVIFTAEGQMVRADVYLEPNDERLLGLDGDGLVVSTTTGSTAYSLNAGGPIVDPRLDVIIITPLNPVQLYLRPIVLSRSSRLRVRLREDSGLAYLVIDGQVREPVRPTAVISISPCPRPLKVARFNWWANYYERLYARLLSYW